MSQAISGVFLESDNPTLEFIKWLDEKQPSNSKFVIAFLSNTALFIKQSREEFVRDEVTKWQRSNTYEDKTELIRAFKEMCQLKYDKVYMEAFPQLTKKFNSISETVRAYEKQLVALGHDDLAATVRNIQEHERCKLQTTLRIHALRKDYSFRALDFQHSSPDSWSVAPGQAPPAENEGALAVQHTHDHTDNGAVPQCCCKVRPPASISQFEGTREEFQSACNEATKTLELSINEINEQLADISCELSALRENDLPGNAVEA